MVTSLDTDVLVLSVAFQEKIVIDNWLKAGVKRETKYIPVRDLFHVYLTDLNFVFAVAYT